MAFTLPPLPFAKDELGEFMSEETLDFHHGKHHRAYVDKTNALLEEQGSGGRSLVEVIRGAHAGQDQSLFNVSAQLWNHTFFWNCLAPPTGQKPVGRLAVMIDEEYGSVEGLLTKLEEEAVAHFSNGWAWLVLDRDKLAITSLHDADSPVVHDGMRPLLTLDVWEHAYYIDYRHARADFAAKVLGNIINWEFVALNLDGRGETRADQQG